MARETHKDAHGQEKDKTNPGRTLALLDRLSKKIRGTKPIFVEAVESKGGRPPIDDDGRRSEKKKQNEPKTLLRCWPGSLAKHAERNQFSWKSLKAKAGGRR